MKTYMYILASLLCSSVASADGGSHVGGGDIQCDAVVKKLAANLSEWIVGKGPENFKLDLSSTLNPVTKKPYTYFQYEVEMLKILEQPLDVSCVKLGDPGYPVSVGDSTKICATSVDARGVHMKCDRDLFLKLTPDEKVGQNHHEFAISIPGLEPDTGPVSTYKISIQLSAYTQNVIERLLPVENFSQDQCSVSTDYDHPAIVVNGMKQVGYWRVDSVVRDLKALSSSRTCHIEPATCRVSTYDGGPVIAVNSGYVGGYWRIDSVIADLKSLQLVGACAVEAVDCSVSNYSGYPALRIGNNTVGGYYSVIDVASDLAGLRDGRIL